ncbi:MAG: hypothetical protein P8X74_05735 [Reinekea sp.]|jgi:hypothetical protein
MILKSLALTMIVSAITFLLWLQNHNDVAVVPVVNSQQISLKTTEKLPSPESENTKPESKSVNQSVTSEDYQEPIVIDETLSPQLQLIAQSFEAMAAFPSFSMPIFAGQSITKYQPNRSAEITYDNAGVHFSLNTSAFKYQPDETISGTVTMTPKPAQPILIEIIQDGQVLDQLTLHSNGEQLNFSFSPLGQSWQADELLVVASTSIEGEPWSLSTPVKKINIDQAAVELVEIEKSSVDGPWLEIPVVLNVIQSGYFSLEANLYSQADDRPLVHLSQQEELSAGRKRMLLKAHIQALKQMNDEGDYLLSDFDLIRMPSPPNFTAYSGVVPFTAQKVKGFPFSAYSDEPWQDAETQARLDFLQQISQ